jgi:hypothetical protein
MLSHSYYVLDELVLSKALLVGGQGCDLTIVSGLVIVKSGVTIAPKTVTTSFMRGQYITTRLP